MSTTVKRVSTGRLIQAVLPASEDPVEYPEDYFRLNPGKVKVFINKELELNLVRQFVYEGLRDKTASVCHVNTYLYHVLKDIKDDSYGDWKSFGIQIAKRGTKVGIFDLLDVKEYKGDVPDGKPSPDRTVDDDRWLPMLILGLYRVGRATQEDYKRTIMSNLMAQCKLRHPAAEDIVDDTSDFYQLWGNDSNYLKIVAATDMFFHHFKKHPEASLRFGTIVSRFKDCAALNTLSHLHKVTGLSIGEVFSWVLTRSAEDDLVRMMKAGQEVDQASSFMPYLIDLGLSTKSPYSSVKNPSFHFWGQLTALLVQSTRAKNARVPDEIPYAELTKAALLFGYAIGHSSDLSQRFIEGDKVYQKETDAVEYIGVVPPTTKDVTDWLGWWDDVKNVATTDMNQFAKRAVQGLTDIRVRTIGEYAKRVFT
ncbi:nucleoprotein [Mejal virus]|uniref:Nucleoprotein n=1 Tax=Mejal virus TaxID=2838395 RepID=A0A8E6Z791_9RHAB|nr:nucleoprotein [Mejal virus]QVU40011.1 nucleoprotein [Mejal virus]